MFKEIDLGYALKKVFWPFGPSNFAQYGQNLAEDKGYLPPFSKLEMLRLRGTDLLRTAVLAFGMAAALVNDKPLLAFIPPLIYGALGLVEMLEIDEKIAKSNS